MKQKLLFLSKLTFSIIGIVVILVGLSLSSCSSDDDDNSDNNAHENGREPIGVVAVDLGLPSGTK